MKSIAIDTGLQTYRLGAGTLRFNPADPNLYARFQEATGKIAAMEQALTENSQSQDMLALTRQTDRQVKALLNWVFGLDNDFDQLLSGVNVLAMTGTGQRVIANLFDALEPILLEGARRCAQTATQQAVAKANARRAAQ